MVQEAETKNKELIKEIDFYESERRTIENMNKAALKVVYSKSGIEESSHLHKAEEHLHSKLHRELHVLEHSSDKIYVHLSDDN